MYVRVCACVCMCVCACVCVRSERARVFVKQRKPTTVLEMVFFNIEFQTLW